MKKEYEKPIDLESMKIFLDERLSELEYRLNIKFGKFDPEKIESILNKILCTLDKHDHNAAKFDVMVKELNGAICKCRALFKDQINRKPVWYDIEKHAPPKIGEIWVKDIEGNETIATCKGLAIIYAASSSVKLPEFWKPV